MTIEEFMEALQDLGDLIDGGCDNDHCDRYASRWDISGGEWSIQIAPRFPYAVATVDVRDLEVIAVRLDGRLTAYAAMPLDQLFARVKAHVYRRAGRPHGAP